MRSGLRQAVLTVGGGLAVAAAVIAGWRLLRSSGGDAAPPGIRADELFAAGDQVIRLDMEVDAVRWEWLQANARAETYVPGRLTFRGRTHDARVRFKGHLGTLHGCFDAAGTRTCRKLSVKIDVRGPGEVETLVLNSSVRDESYLRERFAYELYRAAGLPAPRTAFAELVVNGQTQGLYVLVEAVDRAFVERHFPGQQGALYKEVWPLYERAAAYRGAAVGPGDPAGADRMVALARILTGPAAADLGARVGREVDLAHLARFLAVALFLNNIDGPHYFHCVVPRDPGDADLGMCQNTNYYWFQPAAGPLVLLPWDLDLSLWARPAPSPGLVDPGGCAIEWLPGGRCELADAAAVRTLTADQIQARGIRCEGQAHGLFPARCDRLLALAMSEARAELAATTRRVIELAPDVMERVQLGEQVQAVIARDPGGHHPTTVRRAGRQLAALLGRQLAAARAFVGTPR